MFDLSQEAKPQAVVLFPSGTLIDDEYFSVAILSIYKEYADYADSFFPQIQETVKKKIQTELCPLPVILDYYVHHFLFQVKQCTRHIFKLFVYAL